MVSVSNVVVVRMVWLKLFLNHTKLVAKKLLTSFHNLLAVIVGGVDVLVCLHQGRDISSSRRKTEDIDHPGVRTLYLMTIVHPRKNNAKRSRIHALKPFKI